MFAQPRFGWHKHGRWILAQPVGEKFKKTVVSQNEPGRSQVYLRSEWQELLQNVRAKWRSRAACSPPVCLPSPGPTRGAQEAQTLRGPRHLPAVSMPRIVSANGPADEVQGTSTHNHRKLQTGQKSAQCHKGRVCASPVSASKSPINTAALVFFTGLKWSVIKLDEEESQERLNFRSLAWFSGQTEPSAEEGQKHEALFLTFFCSSWCGFSTSLPTRVQPIKQPSSELSELLDLHLQRWLIWKQSLSSCELFSSKLLLCSSPAGS